MILSGKDLASKLKNNMCLCINNLKDEVGITPHLVVIIVGNNPASQVYVKNKEKACAKCNIDSLKYELPETTTESELIELVNSSTLELYSSVNELILFLFSSILLLIDMTLLS